jgi:hypothetical protein
MVLIYYICLVDFRLGRELLNYEQYANSIDLEPEYVFYATLLWFAVALVGFFLLYVIVTFILNLLLSKKTGNLFWTKKEANLITIQTNTMDWLTRFYLFF